MFDPGEEASLRGKFDCSLSGSTCSVVVQRGQRLTCAWVGDSRAVAAYREENGGYVAKNISEDHRADLVKEKERILSQGGQVRRLDGLFIFTRFECSFHRRRTSPCFCQR